MWADLYEMAARDTDDAIDVLYDRVDSMLTAGDWAATEAAVQALDEQRLDVALLVAAISITRPAAERLPSRLKLIARLREVEPTRAERLLQGLL
jgi:hypothetical protein